MISLVHVIHMHIQTKVQVPVASTTGTAAMTMKAAATDAVITASDSVLSWSQSSPQRLKLEHRVRLF